MKRTRLLLDTLGNCELALVIPVLVAQAQLSKLIHGDDATRRLVGVILHQFCCCLHSSKSDCLKAGGTAIDSLMLCLQEQ